MKDWLHNYSAFTASALRSELQISCSTDDLLSATYGSRVLTYKKPIAIPHAVTVYLQAISILDNLQPCTACLAQKQPASSLRTCDNLALQARLWHFVRSVTCVGGDPVRRRAALAVSATGLGFYRQRNRMVEHGSTPRTRLSTEFPFHQE